MDVIQTFEDLSPAANDRREPGELTPVGTALGAVLSEIDEIAKATFSSIPLATMLRLIERQQRSDAGSQTRTQPSCRRCLAPRSLAKASAPDLNRGLGLAG